MVLICRVMAIARPGGSFWPPITQAGSWNAGKEKANYVEAYCAHWLPLQSWPHQSPIEYDIELFSGYYGIRYRMQVKVLCEIRKPHGAAPLDPQAVPCASPARYRDKPMILAAIDEWYNNRILYPGQKK